MSDLTEPSLPRPGAPTQQNTATATLPPFHAAPAGQEFGEYELLSEIARGGMGVVYRARQIALDRVVALKMILAGRLANNDDVQRFRTEAAAAARLQHPNIVAVYHVGDIDGQHFFTMEYIEGSSLDRRLAHGPLSSRQAARYVRTLARAVHFAHRNGILHRDLKPSNILIDASDEPHITDFGLAKQLGGAHALGQTRTGTVLGTPSYMAPEQAQGKTHEMGPACDIYSLGAILYELLTGRPPFKAETPLDTVLQVIDHQPVPPRLLNPNIDADLETICLKCLEKDPKLRYASAEVLADDLQHYLDGESIQAHSFNVLDRLSRMLDRSVHTEAFTTWSTMLLGMAAIVAVEHVAVFTMIATEQPRPLILLVRMLQFVLLGVLFWYNRGSRLLPTTPAERELWSIWMGYFAGYGIILLSTRLLLHYEVLRPGDGMSAHISELLPYPFLAVTAGLCLFIMGSNYWGRCYAIGLAFLLMAALMPLHLASAPLQFGLLWSGSLVVLSRHLRKQGQLAAEHAAAGDLNVTTVAYEAPPTGEPRP